MRLPVQLQRAMAAEAEAAREARAKVIAAEGEQKASRALREASEVIGDSPAALQLRYLQVSQPPSNIKVGNQIGNLDVIHLQTQMNNVPSTNKKFTILKIIFVN